MNDIDAVKSLLQSTSDTIKMYRKDGWNKGELYNVFKVLDSIIRLETKVHTPFLANLLDPQGNHMQGAIFLKLFIDQLKSIGFTSFPDSLVEASADDLNDAVLHLESRGDEGQVDIRLEYKGFQFVIENKIGDPGTEKQIKDYWDKWCSNSDGMLLYLTLDGCRPKQLLRDSGFESGAHYYCISYKHHILGWLEQCIEQVKSELVVVETIKQYTHAVRILTNQTIENKMNEKIGELICTNKETYDAAYKIWEVMEKHNAIMIRRMGEKVGVKTCTTFVERRDGFMLKSVDAHPIYFSFDMKGGNSVRVGPVVDDNKSYPWYGEPEYKKLADISCWANTHWVDLAISDEVIKLFVDFYKIARLPLN